jgi:hypothetical protein
VDAVLATRAAVGHEALVHRIFRAAGLGMLLVDHGYQTGDSLSHAELAAQLPCPLASILRLETLAQDLIVRHDTFDQVVDGFVATVEGARAAGHVGLKSIVAYRTGLAVSDTPRSAAAAAFVPVKERAKRAGRVRLADKPLNDYLVHRALEIAARVELPVQFHTGFGDDDLDLRAANPLHLRSLLQDPTLRGASFVLLHTFPFSREAGYLAGLYPHVYVDLSLTIPFTAHGGVAAIRAALEQAPTSKLLLATDAFSIPELFYLGAHYARLSLAVALDSLRSEGWLTASQAEEAAHQMLHENAAALYGVG